MDAPYPPLSDPSARDAALDALSAPALSAVFAVPTRLGVPSAWYGHVPFAHWLVEATRPSTIVELGTHNGVSYAAFCEAVARGGGYAQCTAVDTWQGDEHAGWYGDEVYNDLRAFHDVRYGAFSTLMRCTFDQAAPFFADGSIDLLHIDGLHTYEAVRHDWESWRPKLSPRAVVLFHDINEHQGSFGVWRLWEELRAVYPSFTFLHAHGLGVLGVGERAPAAAAGLCGLSAEASGRLRERFAQLGARWDVHAEYVQTHARRQAAEARVASLLGEAEAQTAVHEQAVATVRRDVTAEMGGRLGRARERLEEAEGEARFLEDQVAARDKEMARLHARLAQWAEDWERVHRVLAIKEAEAEQARAAHRAMQGSAAWRYTAPLRRVEGVLPAGVTRRAVRLVGAARMVASGGLGRRRALRARREAEVAALRESPLFDAGYYLAAHPELAEAGHDPASHYAWVGAWAGAQPNPAFDSGWYLARHPGLEENPLLHWAAHAAEGGRPNAWLDAAWYAARHLEAAGDPLLHYLQVGGPGDLDPNPMLDAAAYKLEYPHARDSGRSALEHWWHHGAAMAFNPHPLFDAAWYRERHGLPPEADPLAHWLDGNQGLPTSALMARAGELTLAFAAEPVPDVSVIVPVYGHYADTLRCLAALAASGDACRFEVLVVDDCPEHRTVPLLEQRAPGIRGVMNPGNLGFLRSCNGAVRHALGRHVVFLNSDTMVHAGWLDALLRLMERTPDAGMIGCKLLNADGTVQEAGGSIGSDGWGIPYGAGGDPAAPELNFVREVDVVIGAAFMVRREAWDAVGGFDDRYAPAFYEEFDLAFAMRQAGWRVLYQPASVVDHLGANSYGAEVRDRQSGRNHAAFCRKWEVALRGQPGARAPELRLRARPHDAPVLLFVDDRVPEWDRHAGALTNWQYIRLWQSMGYHVVFAPVADTTPVEPYTGVLQQQGVEVLHSPVRLENWLERHGRNVDVVWTARPDVTGPLLSSLRRLTSAPIFYYPHDLHHLREQRRWTLEGDEAAREAAAQYARAERRIFGGVDAVLAISGAEAVQVAALSPAARVVRVPPYLYPPPPAPPAAEAFAARDCVLFVGGYAHPPNVDGARFLVQEIMPLVWRDEPEIYVVVAGSAPTDEVLALAGPRVEVPGFLPDLAPLYGRARISVSPLRYGAGVKGKVVAALWEGLPVVLTAVADEGIGLVDGVEGMVADGAEAFAAAVVALWREPARCAALAAAGQEVVRARFTAEAARTALEGAVSAGRREMALAGVQAIAGPQA